MVRIALFDFMIPVFIVLCLDPIGKKPFEIAAKPIVEAICKGIKHFHNFIYFFHSILEGLKTLQLE
jgi:hypothetical protein